MRCDRLQRRPTVCSKPGTVAQREYDAHHHQRTQHTLQLFPITHATFRRSALTARLPCLHHHLRAPRTFPTVRAVPIASDHRADPFRHPTARHPRFPYTARRHRQHPPAALHALMASILSATTRPRRVHRRTETTRSRRSSSSYAVQEKIPLCSLLERAAAPAAFRERRPTASARGREGEGLLLRDCWRSAGSDAAYISFFAVLRLSQLYVLYVILLIEV
ncbi:hypothetical protein B0H13DRAFT_2041423 [Mycena leptocephala]|nr:hypothetical protein B0H13DRAFT_2041423 [Mycena leptocephala]